MLETTRYIPSSDAISKANNANGIITHHSVSPATIKQAPNTITTSGTMLAQHQTSEAQRHHAPSLSPLLWLNYMNADGAAAHDLFEAEPEQLQDYESAPDAQKENVTASSRPRHRRQLSQEEENRLSGWNQLLWLEYLNADGAAAQQILLAEREDIAEYQREWEKVAQDQVTTLSSDVRIQVNGETIESSRTDAQSEQKVSSESTKQ